MLVGGNLAGRARHNAGDAKFRGNTLASILLYLSPGLHPQNKVETSSLMKWNAGWWQP